jgi:hypothetical protein
MTKELTKRNLALEMENALLREALEFDPTQFDGAEDKAIQLSIKYKIDAITILEMCDELTKEFRKGIAPTPSTSGILALARAANTFVKTMGYLISIGSVDLTAYNTWNTLTTVAASLSAEEIKILEE